MSLSSIRRRSTILAAAVLLPLSAGQAQQAEPTIQDLLKRVDEQEQKILVLERRLEIQDDTAKTAKESTPVVKASPKGFSIQSPDGSNVMREGTARATSITQMSRLPFTVVSQATRSPLGEIFKSP